MQLSLRRTAQRDLVRLPVATAAVLLSLVATMLPPAPAEAASGDFSCLPANGLMNRNDPDDLMAGTVTLTNGVRVTIGTGNVDWSRTSLADDSARWLYSLKWVESLTRAYTRTGQDAYLDRAIAIAADFAADNPPDGGPDPADTWYPMYAGQRTTTLACIDSLRPGVASIRDAMSTHATWLAKPANDAGDWNQGIDPALGLLGVGCRLDRPVWRDLAADRFDRLISVNIDAEGALNEQAPGYARFIYERWGLVADKLGECGQAVPSAITTRRPKLLEFAAWATGPDGELVQLGDTYRVPPLAVPGTATDFVTSAGSRGKAPSATHRVYSAGYVFGRNRWTPFARSMHYTLRFGPGMAYHGHEDHTSVTLSAYGKPVLIDSGHVGYTTPAYRDHLRSPEAHNVLVVPGEGLRRRRPTQLTRTDGAGDWRFFEVSDDVWNGHERTRGLLADTATQTLLVQDRATRSSPGAFDQLWHLARGSTVTIDGRSRAIARDPSGTVETHLVQIPLPGQDLPRGATGVVTGQTNPYLGWVAPGDKQWQPAPVVRMSRVGRSTRMVTAIVPTTPGTAVSTASIWTGSNWLVRVVSGSTVRTYGISSGGGMWLASNSAWGASPATTPPPRGAVRVSGDWDGDGIDEPGWFKDGKWGLHDIHTGDTTLLSYGQAGDRPVAGDWDGDGVDTIGVVRGNLWIMRNEYRRGAEDILMYYGNATDTPVTGDWDGNGTDTLGVVRDNLWILRNRYKRGAEDILMHYGNATDTPVTGDWDGNGTDTLGVVRDNLWILRNRYKRGAQDILMHYGNATDTPVTGDWDGNGTDTLGIVRDDLWVLRNEYRRSAKDVTFRY